MGSGKDRWAQRKCSASRTWGKKRGLFAGRDQKPGGNTPATAMIGVQEQKIGQKKQAASLVVAHWTGVASRPA
jgi:hypothetical protein